MKHWLFVLLSGMLLSAGCTSTSMKGTPFYTGEYEVREGPAADRVNLWPLLYYRDPALSVLWPLMESSPDHLAVRPVYSVYNRNTDRAIHNVVWPIGRFDPANEDYRFFPFYWGDEYLTVFPLYWHKGEPFSGVGYNSLFPLWIWNNKDDGYSLDVLWPFCAKHEYPDRQGWRAWPLAGSTDKIGSHYCYYAWPIVHHWEADSGKKGHAVAPLYLYAKGPSHTRFLSLPYSRSLAEQPGAKSWDLALPLWYRQWTGESFYWEFYPALSWGKRDEERSDNWYALGLGRRLTSPDRRRHHVIPLYYFDKDSEARALYTLPWWSKKYADGSGWNSLVPLYYRSHSDDTSAFYSLPWLSKTYADGASWHASIPFYYHSRSDGASVFYSLPWLSESHEDGSEWKASFPFYFSSASADGSIMLTPLYARKLQGDGSLAWRCFIPFVYLDETKDAHFMTPLGGRWRMGDQHNWLALPLLSGGAKDADNGRNIWLAGMAGQQWRGDDRSHYIFPLYYAAPNEGTFVSLPYTAWSAGERKTHILPFLLSGWHAGGKTSGSFLAGGLAGHRRGENPYHYMIPFYYAAPDKGSLISIPYAKWRAGDRQNHAIPLLLSGWYNEGETSGSILLGGLAGNRRGGDDAYHYVFPFYYTAPPKGTFLSLPYATWRNDDKQNHAVPLLLSGWSTEGDVSESLWLAGLGAWKKKGGQVQRSHVLPFYLWSRNDYIYTALYGKNSEFSYFVTPLVGRYGGESGNSGSWVFPLYAHKRRPSGTVKGNYLLLGHYNKDEHRSRHGFFGFYDYSRWKSYEQGDAQKQLLSEGRNTNYLLFLGQGRERWEYEADDLSGTEQASSYWKEQYLFPLWNHRINDKIAAGDRLETSALLGFLYDTRHEQKTGEQTHDYLRRRILWRLYHYEKLNGDMSTDIFPGITIDSYKNGYYKCSVLWRLFRYEKDPESGSKKLDLLFLPLRR
jgi:hypothetical protein